MANTRSSAFSVRLKPETKKRLARLAQASGRSSNFLIADAVDSYVADQERLPAEVRQADRQVKTGHYIRHEDMKAWLLSSLAARTTAMRRCAARSSPHKTEPTRPRSVSRDCLVPSRTSAPSRNSCF